MDRIIHQSGQIRKDGRNDRRTDKRTHVRMTQLQMFWWIWIGWKYCYAFVQLFAKVIQATLAMNLFSGTEALVDSRKNGNILEW